MNTTRLSLVSASPFILGALALLLGGCGAPDDESAVATRRDAITLANVNISGTAQVATLGTPPGNPDTTTVTFFSEAGLWGDSITKQVTAATRAEAVTLMTFDQVEAANLVSRISSLRLVCGSHASQVMLLDFPNTGAMQNWWPSGKSFAVTCAPHQTVTVNLHTQAPELADNVGSAHLLAQALPFNEFPFSSFVASNWNGQSFGDGATAPTGVQLQMIDDTAFTLRQDLQLDDFWCGEHDAYMILEAIMNQNKTFTVFVKETYVDEGTGDSWGCRDGMKSALDSGAHSAAQQLAPALASFLVLAGNHPRYYFVPAQGVWVFDIGAGADLIIPGVTVGAPVGTITAAKM